MMIQDHILTKEIVQASASAISGLVIAFTA